MMYAEEIKDQKGQKELEDIIELVIPSKPQYVSVVRLTASGIANRCGMDIEGIEDLKVALAEACTNAITHGRKCKDDVVRISFKVQDKALTVTVSDCGAGFDHTSLKEPDLLNPSEEGGLGIFIIKSLMDEVCFQSPATEGTCIAMTKYFGKEGKNG